MQHEVWARLTSPFSSEALAWIVAEIEPGAGRARVEPAWSSQAVSERLDQQLGRGGWSFALSSVGAAGVIGALSIGSTTRSAALGAERGVPLEQLAELAFARCAQQFGITPSFELEHETYWVDYDSEAKQAVYDPEPVLKQAHQQGVEPPFEDRRAQPAQDRDAGGAPADAEREASSEALAMIERLIDRLKAEGLGKEAARLVATHHGATAEQARELYTRLRALLKQEAGA